VFPGRVRPLHAGFDDPPRLAAAADGESEALSIYRRGRDEIRAFAEDLREDLGGKAARR
jgi:arsenate reductase